MYISTHGKSLIKIHFFNIHCAGTKKIEALCHISNKQINKLSSLAHLCCFFIKWNWASLSVMRSLLASKSCIYFYYTKSKTDKLTIDLWFCFLRQSSEWLVIWQENKTQSNSLISSLFFFVFAQFLNGRRTFRRRKELFVILFLQTGEFLTCAFDICK